MSGKYFLDTNIIIYSFDYASKAKQAIAYELISRALSTGQGIVSYQVVQEFLNVATRKFAKPLTSHDAQNYLQKVLMPLCQVYPSIELYHHGLTLANRTGYSFYDSLILTAAINAGCDRIYTEDLHDNHNLSGFKIINPFKNC